MKNSDKQAFPSISSSQEVGGIKFTSTEGLTKREYFAGLAMQALLSLPPQPCPTYVGGSCPPPPVSLIEVAIKNADELLSKLEA